MTNAYIAHTTSVGTLATHGIKPPTQWTQLHARYEDYLRLDHPVTDKLADEIVQPTGLDIGLLRAAAFNEWHPTDSDRVHATVLAKVHAELEKLYAPIAARAYTTMRGKVTDALKAFTSAAKLVDVNLDPNIVARLGSSAERGQRAWLDAPNLAKAVDALLDPLACAAYLAGADLGFVTLDEHRDCYLLPLVVGNLDRLHRRKVWEAWDSTGRAGRWAALHSLGADLNVHTHPERIAHYRRPAPMAIEFTYNASTGGLNQPVAFDPEDPPPSTLDRIKERVRQ
jgi:hypothetical protein